VAIDDRIAALDRPVPVPDEVAELVAQMIADNGMKAGDALPSEQSLSQMYHVSIPTSQGRRAMVAGDSLVAITAYFRLVEADGPQVHSGTVRTARGHRGPGDRAGCAACDRGGRHRQGPSGTGNHDQCRRCEAAYATGDIAFHAAIIDAAHNRFLSGLMSALSGALHTERELGVRNRIRAGRRSKAVQEHRAILATVEAGDPERAERAILTHMPSGRANVRRYLSHQLEAKARAVDSSADMSQELPAGRPRITGR
jgi:DNA-binding GntR family transcriptional regulator